MDLIYTGVELGGPSGPLLTHREGHGVLEVGATDLDDAHPLLSLGLQFCGERLDRRDQALVDLGDRGDVHRGREAVVARLAEVDVVIGSDRRLATQLTTQQLNGAVRHDLVDIHIALRARAGLPNVEREVVVELSCDHFVGGMHDRLGLPLRQATRSLIDDRGRLLHVAVRVVDRFGHAVVPDREVLQRPLGLRAPIAVGWHLDRSHAVELRTNARRVDAER